MFYHFLWDGKGYKIKRKVMISEYGGLKKIDVCFLNTEIFQNNVCETVLGHD